MTTSVLDRPTATVEARLAFTALPLICAACGARFDPEPSAICLDCLGPLVPEYDSDSRAARSRNDSEARTRRCGATGNGFRSTGTPTLSPDSGFTPLVESPALARRLGVARAWVKNDAVSHPDAVLQGSRRIHSDQRRTCVLARRHRMRVHWQPRECRGGARGTRRPQGLDLHPARPRAGQGHRRRASIGPTWCACVAPTTT